MAHQNQSMSWQQLLEALSKHRLPNSPQSPHLTISGGGVSAEYSWLWRAARLRARSGPATVAVGPYRPASVSRRHRRRPLSHRPESIRRPIWCPVRPFGVTGGSTVCRRAGAAPPPFVRHYPPWTTELWPFFRPVLM